MTQSTLSSSIFRTVLACVFWLSTSCQVLALCCQLTTVVMVVAVAVSSQATATTAPDSRCGIDNGLVADESSCRGFIICLKGLARPLQCSRDLLFNRDRLTCDFPSSVHCGNRPRDVGGGACYTAMINVTLKVRNEIKEPKFQAKVVVQAQRQPLRYVLLIAAGLDPTFRYETTYFDGYGDYVSSINGLNNDIKDKLAVWQPYNKRGEVMTENVDDFIPESDEVISYIYTDALG